MMHYERLAALRRERGYSLRELQRRIEERTGERVAISYLSKLERGLATPTIVTLWPAKSPSPGLSHTVCSSNTMQRMMLRQLP